MIQTPFGKLAPNTKFYYCGRVKVGEFFAEAKEIDFNGYATKGSNICSGYSSARMVLGEQAQGSAAQIWIEDNVLISISFLFFNYMSKFFGNFSAKHGWSGFWKLESHNLIIHPENLYKYQDRFGWIDLKESEDTDPAPDLRNGSLWPFFRGESLVYTFIYKNHPNYEGTEDKLKELIF